MANDIWYSNKQIISHYGVRTLLDEEYISEDEFKSCGRLLPKMGYVKTRSDLGTFVYSRKDEDGDIMYIVFDRVA